MVMVGKMSNDKQENFIVAVSEEKNYSHQQYHQETMKCLMMQ